MRGKNGDKGRLNKTGQEGREVKRSKKRIKIKGYSEKRLNQRTITGEEGRRRVRGGTNVDAEKGEKEEGGGRVDECWDGGAGEMEKVTDEGEKKGKGVRDGGKERKGKVTEEKEKVTDMDGEKKGKDGDKTYEKGGETKKMEERRGRGE